MFIINVPNKLDYLLLASFSSLNKGKGGTHRRLDHLNFAYLCFYTGFLVNASDGGKKVLKQRSPGVGLQNFVRKY
jgi:hypothetical protein